MPKATFSQNSFNFGEVSGRALGRYDAEKPIWKLAVKKLENFLNFKLGGAMFWPSTQYIAPTKNTNQKIRLQPISYNSAQQYVLEIGDRYMRFFANVNGVPGQVIVSVGNPIDSYTVLLSHFDGLNGDTSYTAETNQPFSFFNNAKLDTSAPKFGASSLLLDGASYVTLLDSATWYFAGSDFTVDCWVKFNTTSGIQLVWSQATDNANYGEFYFDFSTNMWVFNTPNGGPATVTGSDTIVAGTWYHVALERTTNTWRIYRDGVIMASLVDATAYVDYTGPFVIGSNPYNGASGPIYFLNGSVDEFRVSKGISRWGGTFTPPTAAYGGATAWVTLTNYIVGDYVVQSGTVYLCLIAHAAGTFATDLAAGKWTAQTQLEIVSPFALADVFSLQFAGKSDVVYIVCAGYCPQKLKRVSSTSFTIANVPFVRGPFLDKNITSTTITPSSATGTTTLTASSAIFLAGHVGSFWRINSGATAGAVVKITAFTSTTVVTAEVQAEPDGTAGTIGGTGAYTNWAEGAFSDVRGWPTAVTFHEQRLVYGKDDFIYASNTGAYDNFNVGSNGFGTASDSTSYTYQIASDLSSATIRWLSSNTSLQIGTIAGTFSAVGGTAGITATAIQVTPDTDYSVFSAQPDKLASYLYYIDANTFMLRQLVYSLELSKQKSEDMTALADHILRDGGGAAQSAHQHTPNDRIWVVRNDGQLAVFTRDAEQGVLAWSRRIGGSSAAGQGIFESLAILALDGLDDQIWVSVQRNINGTVKRFVEVFTAELPLYYYQHKRVDACLSLDNPIAITGITKANPGVITAAGHGLSNGNQVKIDNVLGMTTLNTNSYLVANVTATTFTLTTLAGAAIDTSSYSTYISGGQVRLMVTAITGLSHLNGETVSVQADGAGLTATYTVSAGSITLAAKAAVVHVGLPYTGKLQLLPLGDGSPTGTGQGKMRKIYLSTLRLYQSIGGKIGMVDQFGNESGYQSLVYLTTTPTMPSSEDVETLPDSDFTKFASAVIKQDTPNPLFVLSAILLSEEFEK